MPAATGIATILTPIAALGLAGMMGGAIVTHVRPGDQIKDAVPAVVLGILALVVTILRFGPVAL